MSKDIKTHPVLFSGEMVRAILDGRKTQWREPVTARNSTVNGYRVSARNLAWTGLKESTGVKEPESRS